MSIFVNDCLYSHQVMAITFERKRTSTIVIMYSLYLYFLDDLSLRNTSNTLVIFRQGEEKEYMSV